LILPGFLTQTSCRSRFSRQTRNTYTTPIPLEAHRGSHIITSGLACNTVKHETAVVASFSVTRSSCRPRPRPAPAIGMQRRITAMRSASGRRPRARSESSPDSLQTPHAACCGAVGQTPEHQTPPRSHLRVRGPGGVTGTGRRGRRPRSPGHIPRYDRDVHSSPLAPPLALHEPTFIRSDVHGTR